MIIKVVTQYKSLVVFYYSFSQPHTVYMLDTNTSLFDDTNSRVELTRPYVCLANQTIRGFTVLGNDTTVGVWVRELEVQAFEFLTNNGTFSGGNGILHCTLSVVIACLVSVVCPAPCVKWCAQRLVSVVCPELTQWWLFSILNLNSAYTFTTRSKRWLVPTPTQCVGTSLLCVCTYPVCGHIPAVCVYLPSVWAHPCCVCVPTQCVGTSLLRVCVPTQCVGTSLLRVCVPTQCVGTSLLCVCTYPVCGHIPAACVYLPSVWAHPCCVCVYLPSVWAHPCCVCVYLPSVWAHPCCVCVYLPSVWAHPCCVCVPTQCVGTSLLYVCVIAHPSSYPAPRVCLLDHTNTGNEVVPIAVGAALGVLVAIVLLAYLLGKLRNRRKSSYEALN